jgi:hypothetical protein
MVEKNNWHTDTKDQNIRAVPLVTGMANFLWGWANGRHIIPLWGAPYKRMKTRNKIELIM